MDDKEPVDIASLEIEAHVERLQAIADPVVRATATDLVSSVLELHRAALAQLLTAVAESSDAAAIMDRLDRDPLVRSILLLYDLHPRSTADRIKRALADLEPRLRKRDAAVELVDLSEGMVALRLVDNHGSCGAAAMVEAAIREAAPEISDVRIETVTPARSGFVSADTLRAGNPSNPNIIPA
jgi:inorganic triphosphatase YgiF